MADPSDDTRRVGPYEILETIGHGAMGEVFLARDSRLSRNVAIKTISPDAELDPNRRGRFIQEARAASRLNHPNIVTIHDFGTENGISYIVTELVEGESLRRVMDRGPLVLRKLVEIASQIADALAAAHEAGIVHRDLKPENVMIAGNGRVKLLDFGVAKPVNGADPEHTLDENHTQPGLLVGTVGYMSPEQARGNPVTIQSDQFAFGIMLHEMATGNHPFRRESPMETLVAIANFERPPFTPGPVGFRMLVDRCMARDPEKRFARTAEIHERLTKIRRELPDAPKPAKVRWWQKISPRTITLVLTGLLVFALGALAAARLMTPKMGDPLTYQFVPFPANHEIEAFPAWAPAGRVIAYSASQDGILQIFTRSTKTWIETQVTKSAEDCIFPFWNNDGTRLFYISRRDGRAALWSVNASGGTPELVYENTVRAAQSPDGKHLAMIRSGGSASNYSLWIAAQDGEPTRYLQAPLNQERLDPQTVLAFSPDSSKLGIWTPVSGGAPALWVVPMNGGVPARAFSSAASSFEWLPESRRVLYSSRDHLWIGDTHDGETWMVTNGTGREQFPSVSSSAREAAFSSVAAKYRVTSLTLGESAPSRTVGAADESSPVWSPTINEYAFVTNRGGSPEMRLRSGDPGWERPLVTAKDFEGTTTGFSDLSFAPNGQSIAYLRHGSDGSAIWITTLTGEPPFRLVRHGAGVERSPAWSPDGNQIAYLSERGGKTVLMKARIGSNERPAVIREDPSIGSNVVWSPKGDWIAATRSDGGLNLISAGGRDIRKVGSGEWLAVAWKNDQLTGLVVRPDRHLALAGLSPESGDESVLSDLGRAPAAFAYGAATGTPAVRGFSVSPDGRRVLFALLEVQSDIWLLRGLIEPGLLASSL